MARLNRVKRDLLREVVAENAHLRTDGFLAPRPRTQPRSVSRGRIIAAVAVGFAVLIVASSLSTIGSTRHTATPTAVPEPDLKAPQAFDPRLFALAVRSIVLDPGHGGADPGARTPSGMAEKDLTLQFARALATELRGGGFDVALTREKDETVSLRERAAFANAHKADIFVSIHVNSIPKPQRRGVETYYLGPSDDPHVTDLAAAENRESGYALHDFKRMLEEVYVGVRQQQSREFAWSVQRSLFSALRKSNEAIEDRGVKSAPFAVLVGAEMPSVLAEVSCVSNEEEAALLQDAAYRERIVQGLFTGIRSYAAARTRAARGGA